MNILWRHLLNHWNWIIAEVVFGWLAGIVLIATFRLPEFLRPVVDAFRLSESRLLIAALFVVFALAKIICVWMESANLMTRWRNNLRCKESFYCSWDHQAAIIAGATMAFWKFAAQGCSSWQYLAPAIGTAVIAAASCRFNSDNRKSQPDQEGSNFLPLETIAQDKLQRAKFVDMLHAAIVKVWDEKSSTGAIIGLSGELGIGKTTVLNFLREKILAKNCPVTPILVRIEPWPIRGATAAQRHILYQLHSALSERYNYAGFRSTLEAYLDFIEKGWPNFGGLSALRSIVGFGGVSLEQEVTRIFQILQRIDAKVLIIVDDLDRLLPLELYSLMRLIDHLRALPNTAFLLSYDPSVTPEKFFRAASVFGIQEKNNG